MRRRASPCSAARQRAAAGDAGDRIPPQCFAGRRRGAQHRERDADCRQGWEDHVGSRKWLWAERGLELGDIILEIDGKPVKTPAEIEKVLREARSAGKRTVLLRLKSGDAMRFLTAPVG
jgi:hypothetical protein